MNIIAEKIQKFFISRQVAKIRSMCLRGEFEQSKKYIIQKVSYYYSKLGGDWFSIESNKMALQTALDLREHQRFSAAISTIECVLRNTYHCSYDNYFEQLEIVLVDILIKNEQYDNAKKELEDLLGRGRSTISNNVLGVWHLLTNGPKLVNLFCERVSEDMDEQTAYDTLVDYIKDGGAERQDLKEAADHFYSLFGKIAPSNNPSKISLGNSSLEPIYSILHEIGMRCGIREKYSHSHFNNGYSESWTDQLLVGEVIFGSIYVAIRTFEDKDWGCIITLPQAICDAIKPMLANVGINCKPVSE